MTTQTPDAVREAITLITEAKTTLGPFAIASAPKPLPQNANTAIWKLATAIAILAALDSRAGDVGKRQAYREAAEDAGWLIEIRGEQGVDEGEIATAWAPAGSYTFGPPITREQVPPGAVYEHGHAPGKLWLNDEPHLMTPDESSFATTFRVATPAPAVDAPTERQIALAKLTAMDDEMGLPDEPLPISPNAVDAVEMAAFGASEHACALYPGEDQAAERAAFIAGAAHEAKSAVDAVPAGEDIDDWLRGDWYERWQDATENADEELMATLESLRGRVEQTIRAALSHGEGRK